LSYWLQGPVAWDGFFDHSVPKDDELGSQGFFDFDLILAENPFIEHTLVYLLITKKPY
jgi:hypothetical protein